MSDLITLETGEELDLSLYPLPDGIEDEKFNREMLARAMNVSVVTITKWVDDGMPVAQRGGNGLSYEFLFSHCYAWRLWREGQEAAERQTKLASANQMAMLFMGEEDAGENPKMSAKDIREWSEASLIRNKAALDKGELAQVFKVERLLEDLLVGVRNTVANAPDWLEQEFSLTPHQVDRAQTYFDNLLAEMRAQIIRECFNAPEVVPLGAGAESAVGE